MPRMTQSEVNAYLARNIPKLVPAVGGDKEADLHREILAECKRRGFIAFHGSMAHSTFRTPGEPDFIILADKGRVILVECKAGKGKLSPEQRAIHIWADVLGHTVHVIRTLHQFIELTKISGC